MEQKIETITIKGVQYPVVFNAKTIMNFEEIADKSFFNNSFSKTTDRIALLMAAVKACDEKSDLKIESLLGITTLEELTEVIKAYTVVAELGADFMKIPKVTAEAEAAEQAGVSKEEQESVKN